MPSKNFLNEFEPDRPERSERLIFGNNNELDKRNWFLVKGWLEFSQQQIQKIKKADPDRYDRIKSRVSDYAKASAAVERITDLTAHIVEDRSQGKLMATAIVTVLGSFFYARGAYLLFSPLGDLALFAALMAGLGASFVVDWFATNALTNRLYSRHKEQVIAQAKHRIDFRSRGVEARQQLSDLKKFFLEQKIFHINDIEVISTVKGFSYNVVFAVILNIIEYVSALYVINQIFAATLEIPLPLQMIIGLLPVALTWAAANIKAQSFGLLDYYKKTIRLYEPELRPPFGETEQDWLDNQELQDRKLDSGIQILVKEVIDNNVPTADAAEYLFERDDRLEKKSTYEYRQEKEIIQLERKYQDDETEIYDRWAKEIKQRIGSIRSNINQQLDKILHNSSNPDTKKSSVDDFSEYIKKSIEEGFFSDAQKNIVKKCQQQRDNDIQKLKEDHDAEIKWIQAKYNPIIKAYENEYKKADRKYQEECEQHKEREYERKLQAELERETDDPLWELQQKINEQFGNHL